jgi:hypothetical protein
MLPWRQHPGADFRSLPAKVARTYSARLLARFAAALTA